MNKSILLNSDSYKVAMHRMYPPGTESVYSYIEARGGIYDKTVFFGLQAFIQEYLAKPITKEDVDFAEKIWNTHGEPFDRTMWDSIVNDLGGRLPLVIRGAKEGCIIPTKNVLVTVENTGGAKYRGLTTWVETALLRAVWYPTSVATTSLMIKRLIGSYLEKSGDIAAIDFKLHNFGSRGCSSRETAGIGGAAHLTQFMGTDTIEGVLFAMEYYGADICGFSVPAAEHSIACAWSAISTDNSTVQLHESINSISEQRGRNDILHNLQNNKQNYQ